MTIASVFYLSFFFFFFDFFFFGSVSIGALPSGHRDDDDNDDAGFAGRVSGTRRFPLRGPEKVETREDTERK